MASSLSSMFPFVKQKKYAPLQEYRDEEGNKALLTEEGSLSSNSTDELPVYRQPSKVPFRLSLGFNIIFLCSTIALLITTWPQLVIKFHDKHNNALLRQVSQPSPVFDQLHIGINTVKRNGSLLPGNPPSIFRQEPSDEVDAAWHRLANINPVPLSSADVSALGYDPKIVARWPEEYGLGDDAYVGRLDVFHEIHCLDLLRREAHYDYYYREDWPQGPPLDHRVHVAHCVHALLQSIMCSANTDPFIHYWVDVGDEPYPDFSINRQCRDFDAVLKWQEEKSIPMSQFRNVIRKPEGVAPRIMSQEYKYMVGLIKDEKLPDGSDEIS